MGTILANRAVRTNNDLNSIVKDIFGEFLKKNVYEILDLKKIKESVFLKSTNEDLLSIVEIGKEQELKNSGYEETTADEYISTLPNCVLNVCEIKNINERKFLNSISALGKEIQFKKTENKLLLIDENFELLLSVEYDIKKIFDFIVDEEGFVYMSLLSLDNKCVIIKSHLAFDFIKFNENFSDKIKIKDLECLFCLEVDDEIKKILSSDDEKIQYINSCGKIKEMTFGRKYYFAKNENLFFNIVDDKKYEPIIQVEHLHLYDWISILGLNKFKDKKGLKLSTKYLEKIKNIFNFKFDDTRNGALNYYDFFDKKDYKVDVFKSGIKATGNFIYNYMKGSYKISITALEVDRNDEINYYVSLVQNNKVIKNICGATVNRVMYFCNLKFEFLSYEYKQENIEIIIDIKDEYSSKFISVSTFDIPDKNETLERVSVLDQVLRNENKNKKQLLEIDYEDNHIVVKNFIKDSNDRKFDKDLKIKLIEDDGTPSLLWKQIKNKDYFLTLNEYTVKKVIRPVRKIKGLLKTTSSNFKINKIK